VADLHGRPWKPHQRLAADVLGELLPTGGYAYPIGVVLFPRQTGKTTFILDLALGRGLMYPDFRAAYAAQTGHVTTERMVERMGELADGPLASRARMRRSAGTERVTLPGRSYLKAFPPKAGALRSNALDLVLVDEAQEHGVVLGQQLDLTILPTFSTRPRRQLILIGTAGTDASDYLLRYLQRARARTPGSCVIEYGALDGEDIDDETMWGNRHPGLTAGLTDTDYLRSMRAVMGFAGFGREFFNVWSRTSDRSIDPTDWAAVQDPAAAVTGAAALGFDVDPGRGSAAIAVADAGVVELVDHHDGTDWLIGRLLELQTTHKHPIACARYGAAGPTVDALEQAGAELLILTAGDAGNAAASIADAIEARTLRVRPSPVLTESVEGAAKRLIADSGGFMWARRDAASNPAPLIAASYARWGALHAPDRRRPVATMGGAPR
jgi:hypothetical protein